MSTLKHKHLNPIKKLSICLIQMQNQYIPYNFISTDNFKSMRKFGGLGTGKSPLRQRPQPKNSMTSLASLAEMVGQANEDDYSNIKLCLNSERPQLELEQPQQNYQKNWKEQSPLRRGLMNKENDFNQFINKNAFEGNRFTDCIMKERVEGAKNCPSPLIGGFLSKNKQDVSPAKNRSKLQEADFVFKAGLNNGARGMNFSQISKKFNEQEDNNNQLLAYTPKLEESRPKSRSKAPKLQKQFDEDDFININESIRNQEFVHNQVMNQGQRLKFESKIQQIKQQKIRFLKDKQNNKTLLPKIIQQIKANATRQIQEYALQLFNQSKREDYSDSQKPESHQGDGFQGFQFQKVAEKPRVIIGSKPHVIKPIESHLAKTNNSAERWSQNQMPLVESQYPQDFYQHKIQTKASPFGIRLQPQPTKLAGEVELKNSNDVVATSVKEISLEFSRKQNQLIQQLQKKRQDQERISKQRQEEQKQILRQQNLIKEMQEKRRKFEEDARIRQEQAAKLQQQRITRELQRKRNEQQMIALREQQQRRAEVQRRKQQQLQIKRRQQERARYQYQERLRQTERRLQQQRIDRLQQQRVEKQRRELQQRQRLRIEQQSRQRQAQVQRVQREIREAREARQAQEARQVERMRLQVQQKQRLRRQEEQSEKLRLQIERTRLEEQRQRLELQRIEFDRIEKQRLEKELFQRQRAQTEALQRERIQRQSIQRQRLEQQRIQKQRIQQQRIHRQTIERENRQREQFERQRIQRQNQLQRQRAEEERIRNQNIEKERERERESRILEEEDRKKKILAEFQQQKRKEEALRQKERLETLEKQRLETEKLASAPVNSSFKFDYGGDDLKTSFKFDNLFTNFSLGTTETADGNGLGSPLQQLTANKIKESINVTSSNMMDFKFDFGLN